MCMYVCLYPGEWKCEICEQHFQSRYRYKRHLNTEKHKALANVLADSYSEMDVEQSSPIPVDMLELGNPEVGYNSVI